MKIAPTSPTGASAVGSKKKVSSAGGSGFAEMLDGLDAAAEAGEAGSVGVTAAAGSVGSILAVQEVSERQGGRKRAVKRAGLTLDVLDELRNALLMGEVPSHLLRRLSERLKDQKAETADGRLLEILKEVEVRAAVELAKLERAR